MILKKKYENSIKKIISYFYIKNGYITILKNLLVPCKNQAPEILLVLLQISRVNIPWVIVLIINILEKFWGCNNTKLNNDVKYATFKLVLDFKNINKTPLKKNSSVKDSIKLIKPSNKLESEFPLIKNFEINVINIINGKKNNPYFKLFSNPILDIPKEFNWKSVFSEIFLDLFLMIKYRINIGIKTNNKNLVTIFAGVEKNNVKGQ